MAGRNPPHARSIRNAMVLTLLAICLVAGLVLSVFLFYQTRDFAILEAEKHVQNILLEHRAIHDYMTERQKPALYKLKEDGKLYPEFFAPELLSSTYITRNMHAYHNAERRERGLPEIYYKLAATNPRNPVNRADAFERQLIERFNAGRIDAYRDVIVEDGLPALYYAVPFARNSEQCMLCHSSPDRAPAELVARYGREGGFQERIGETRAILSIRVPLKPELRAASRRSIPLVLFTFGTLILFVTGGGAILLGSITRKLEHTVADRTRDLHRTVEELEQAVTTQKQAEAALREREEQSRVLFESAPVGIGLAAPDGGILSSNPAMCRILGYTQEQLAQANLQALYVDPEDRNRLLGHMRAEGQVRDFETRLRRSDGSVITVTLSISRIQLGGREVFLTVAQDVTQRKQDEERLRVSETNYRSIFNAANDAIFVHDMASGDIVDMNAKVYEMYGAAPGEFSGLKVSDLSAGEPPFAQEDALRWMRKASRGDPQIFEWRARDRAGRLFWVEVNLKRAAIGGGQRLLAVVRDITQRKQMEEELARVQKLESLGLLAGGIAHDFNNILTAVLSNISLARTYGDLKEEIADILHNAETAVLRAQGLTGQLLTFARGGVPVKRVLAVSRLVRDTAPFALSGSNVRAEFAIPDDLRHVEADEGQIGQVVQNLVINAEQAMPEGGTVRVRVENVAVGQDKVPNMSPGNYVRISVEDEGCGIAAKHMSKIFDPFFTTKEKGRGLGLATSYSIVKRHGGCIQVESEADAATTFHVYLPASDLPLEAQGGSAKGPVAGTGRILVVDDEQTVRRSAGEVLKRLGFEVAFAEDGEEGIARYREAMGEGRSFDAVIMDLTIPGGMGGAEAVAALREIDPCARVIVSSGYSDHPVMADFRGHGFDGAVHKPFGVKDLAQVVHEVLGTRRGS